MNDSISCTGLSRRTALLALAGGLAVPMIARAQDMATAAGKADDYVTQTMIVGTVALETSKLAVQKATDANVKKFAELEVGEQETIAMILKANGATPPPLPADMQAKIDALKSLSGKEFDAKYLDAQVEGHTKLLAIQKSKEAGDAKDIHVAVAKLAAQSVMTHLAMLDLIKKAM